MSDEEQKMTPEQRKANQKYNSYTDRLTVLYDTTEGLSEDIPAHLEQKLAVYGHILEVVGNLHSLAVQEFKRASSAKIEARAVAFLKTEPTLSVKEREAKADLMIRPYRKRRDDFQSYAKRWENAYKSIYEQIQIMKYKIKDFQIEKGQGNQSRGGL